MEENYLDSYDQLMGNLSSARAVLMMLRCLASCTATHGETGIHMLASMDAGTLAWLLKDATEKLDNSMAQVKALMESWQDKEQLQEKKEVE